MTEKQKASKRTKINLFKLSSDANSTIDFNSTETIEKYLKRAMDRRIKELNLVQQVTNTLNSNYDPIQEINPKDLSKNSDANIVDNKSDIILGNIYKERNTIPIKQKRCITPSPQVTHKDVLIDLISNKYPMTTSNRSSIPEFRSPQFSSEIIPDNNPNLQINNQDIKVLFCLIRLIL